MYGRRRLSGVLKRRLCRRSDLGFRWGWKVYEAWEGKLNERGTNLQVENAGRHIGCNGQTPETTELQKLQSLEKHISRCADARKICDWQAALTECDAAVVAGAVVAMIDGFRVSDKPLDG
ncbi:hypothetical protein LguiA_031492 [Lonicera macranthoides]